MAHLCESCMRENCTCSLGGGRRLARERVSSDPTPMKLGNASGGKGPQFKAGAESGDAQEIGVTLRNSGSLRKLRKAPHAEAKDQPGFRSGERMFAQVAAFAVV